VEAAETGKSLNRLIIDRLLGYQYAPVAPSKRKSKPKATSAPRRAAKTQTKRDSFA
jgi:hypothetical protein